MRSADFALALPNFVTAVEIAKTVKCAACACLSFPSPRSRAGLDPQFLELILTRPGVMASPSFDRVIESSNRRQNPSDLLPDSFPFDGDPFIPFPLHQSSQS